MLLKAIQGDITQLRVDAIVNAANSSLLGGGGVASLAFPSISTGIFGYPIEEASTVAVATVRQVLAAGCTVQSVIFCCFSKSDLAIYEAALS